jgi:transcriptional regulator with XRE-family HTH domain
LAKTLIKKVPIGTCACGKCGQTVYEHHYKSSSQWGVTVIPRLYVRGHNPKNLNLDSGKRLYAKLVEYRRKHNLTWQDLADHIGVETGHQLSQLQHKPRVTARFSKLVEEGLSRPPSTPSSKVLVEAKPIYDLLKAYKSASGKTWAQIAPELELKPAFLYGLGNQKFVLYQTAQFILLRLTELRKLPRERPQQWRPAHDIVKLDLDELAAVDEWALEELRAERLSV